MLSEQIVNTRYFKFLRILYQIWKSPCSNCIYFRAKLLLLTNTLSNSIKIIQNSENLIFNKLYNSVMNF